MTRRNLFRVAGTTGAAGVFAGSLTMSPGIVAPAEARRPKKIRAALDRTSYAPGQQIRLRVTEQLGPRWDVQVTDTSGTVFARIKSGPHRQVWTARAIADGPSSVVVTAVRPDGRRTQQARFRDRATYQVTGNGSDTSPSIASALVGMSAPAGVWAQRLRQVGPGVGARRIFADLADGPSSQIRLVEEAHAAGMLPVISYKVGGDVAGAVAGRYNSVAEQAAKRLASYRLPTAVTFWHEPYGDLDGARYTAASKQLLPIFKRNRLRVGPILNGWLLDDKRDVFASYCPDELFELWDWVGIDTYESGTKASPGDHKPAERIRALREYLAERGHGDMTIGIGEYNGWSAQTIAEAGEAVLSTPNVWFGCLWNSTGGTGLALSGDRLVAFRGTLADRRTAPPRPV